MRLGTDAEGDVVRVGGAIDLPGAGLEVEARGRAGRVEATFEVLPSLTVPGQ